MRISTLIVGLGMGFVATATVGQETGSLLVASEQIGDETFTETVILLVHHAEEGSVGVALNRPTWVSAREVFPHVEYLHRYRDDVFHGGPLAQATVLVITRGLAPGPEAQPLVDDVYMHANLEVLEAEFDQRKHDASVLRFYAGHASWGPGQLEEELAAGAWRVAPGSAALIFDADPATLWNRLMARDEQLTVDQHGYTPDRPHDGRLVVER